MPSRNSSVQFILVSFIRDLPFSSSLQCYFFISHPFPHCKFLFFFFFLIFKMFVIFRIFWLVLLVRLCFCFWISIIFLSIPPCWTHLPPCIIFFSVSFQLVLLVRLLVNFCNVFLFNFFSIYFQLVLLVLHLHPSQFPVHLQKSDIWKSSTIGLAQNNF